MENGRSESVICLRYIWSSVSAIKKKSQVSFGHTQRRVFRVPMGLLGKRYQRLDFWRETRWRGVIDRWTATPYKCKWKHDQGLESAPSTWGTRNAASEVCSTAPRVSGGDRCYSDVKSISKISYKQQLKTPRNVYNFSGKLYLKTTLIYFTVDTALFSFLWQQKRIAKETGTVLLVKINHRSYRKPIVSSVCGTRHIGERWEWPRAGSSIIYLCQTYLCAQFPNVCV